LLVRVSLDVSFRQSPSPNCQSPCPKLERYVIATQSVSFDLYSINYKSSPLIVTSSTETVQGGNEKDSTISFDLKRGYPPDTIVSDRGPQFISAFWREFTRILGIKLKLSTAHHAPTDGQTEIVNQYIDQRMRPFVNYNQDNWSKLLPIVDYAQATLNHESTGFAPIQLEMGYLPRTSFDWNQPEGPLTARERLSYEEARVYAKRLEQVWVTVCSHRGDV
jgi:hypothetical protein